MVQLLPQSHVLQCNSAEPEKYAFIFPSHLTCGGSFTHGYETIPHMSENGAGGLSVGERRKS